MSGLVVRLRTFLVRLGFALGTSAGTRPHILFASAHAERLGGNLAFLRAELARHHPRVEVAECTYRTSGGWWGRVAGAVNAVRAGWSLARARVVVLDDYFFPLYVVPRRSGAFVVQAWHASGAFKRFGHSLRDASFGADEALTSRVRIHANYDVCLVGSPSAATHYADAFDLSIDRVRWDLGIPRTDLFFGEAAADAAADVRRRYRLPHGCRVVLFAPTFRGGRVTEARSDTGLDLNALAAALGRDHVVLVRLHPFVREDLPSAAPLSESVIDVSDHPDINALMLVSDVLVTDYSSAIFEFSLLERPMAFFAPDLEVYERERGFFVDYRRWVPGPVFDTTEALAQWLRDGPVDLERVRRFKADSFAVADGNASERVVERLLVPAVERRHS